MSGATMPSLRNIIASATYANQFRLLMSSFAYVLLEAIRRLALKGTELARA